MVVHDPDICRCWECSILAWERGLFEEEELRSAKSVIEIEKVRTSGEMPPFLGVVQRHFEKAKPAIPPGVTVHLNAPVDMLGFLIPQALLDTVESVEVVYRR